MENVRFGIVQRDFGNLQSVFRSDGGGYLDCLARIGMKNALIAAAESVSNPLRGVNFGNRQSCAP